MPAFNLWDSKFVMNLRLNHIRALHVCIRQIINFVNSVKFPPHHGLYWRMFTLPWQTFADLQRLHLSLKNQCISKLNRKENNVEYSQLLDLMWFSIVFNGYDTQKLGHASSLNLIETSNSKDNEEGKTQNWNN